MIYDIHEYFSNYNKYKKNIVFFFDRGGLGDFLKCYRQCIYACIKFKTRIHLLLVDKYVLDFVKLIHSKVYITKEELDKKTKCDLTKDNINNMVNGIYYIAAPPFFYIHNFITSYNTLYDKIFYFTNVAINNVKKIMPINITNYVSIHLRMSDAFFESSNQQGFCKNDRRGFSEEKIIKCIKNNSDKQIIFFCDNVQYRKKIANMFSNIIITNSIIEHVGIYNTTYNGVLDTITDFYIMSKSSVIYAASYSGFSIEAASFYDVPIIKIY